MAIANARDCPAIAPARFAERDALVLGHIGLVRKFVARTVRRLPPSVEGDDLTSAGLVGLLAAADAFDRSVQPDFEAFARPRVKGAVLDELRLGDPLGRRQRDKVRSLQEARRELSASLGRQPTEEEIAERLGITLSELGEYLCREESSLASREMEPSDLIDSDATNCEEALVHRSLLRRLREAVGRLPERLARVVRLRYREDLTFESIGAVLGISTTSARDAHEAALRALGRALQV